MKIVLIRHFQTPGNLLGRYIGITDEPLIEEAKVENEYPKVERIFISPLNRCRMTADLIYPDQEKQVVEELRECDFGEFENKNYQELSKNEHYQIWVNSGGTNSFPGGEDPVEFRARCVEGFLKTVKKCAEDQNSTVAFVVHGGTIMSIMEAFDEEGKNFYDYQVKNGLGFVCEFEWTEQAGKIKVVKIL